jgi:microcystin-dependent protein
MSDAFLGEIRMFAGNFAPRGWALCDGQLLSIAQNTALFSLLGTTYGGNGQTTFALPDLRGRAPLHAGQGPGLSNRNLGQEGGTESTTLTVNQLPAHAHPANASSGEASGNTPADRVLAGAEAYADGPDGTTMNPAMVGATGGSQPLSVESPFLVINFIIALQGIFPPRT